ncbi:dTMP kinase [Streptomyces sp. NPDC007088]|uniref:dTMP kinase n=1 Tax=Streptomyces sp. NPDC007088 TaxID=3364773 RepID=UPI0036CF0B34
MTRAEQPPVVKTTSDTALVADSQERAIRALLRSQPLKRLWSAQLVGGVGDCLALLVLVVLVLQADLLQGSFGGGYRGAAFAVAIVFGVRVLATLLFGAVLLGPVSALTAPGGALDRRWTMLVADGVRAALMIVAPLWIDWTPDNALTIVLITAFLAGGAERLWTVCREGAAPGLLPVPPPEGDAVRPLPDHLETLRRLFQRTTFCALPAAALTLVAVSLVGNLLGAGLDWFAQHQAALASYVAAGLFAASLSVVSALELPSARTPRPRSPLEGLRRPRAASRRPRTAGPDTEAGSTAAATPAAEPADKGRTGAVPVLVGACGAVAAAIGAAVSVGVLHARDLGGGPVAYGLIVLALTGGTVLGIRTARSVLPTLSRRRLLSLAIAVAGVALLVAGLVPDITTVLLLLLLAGVSAGVAANTGHTLLDQEIEEGRRARTTEHLQAVARLAVAVAAIAAPVFGAFIGPHRVVNGKFTFEHDGASFTLMLVGALLLPVAAFVLAKTDDRQGVPLRRDLREALRGGDPAQAPATSGFFLALEGGDGAGKSTQAEALAEWIRAKGHEVVVTREPGATPVGKRLRSILLDVSSAGLSHRAEALLYAADRAEHVDTVVRPALERGAVVISDRYIDSSVAYQGAGRDLSPVEVARISRWATGGLVPHLTVLLDVAPEAARERFTEAPDRLESEPAEFHARVRSGFLTLAAADPGRYLVVDGAREPEAVTTTVRHRLDQMLPLSEAEIKAQEEARRAAEEEARRKAEEEAARKAEEERLERERQEQLARLRAEEEERKRRELEEARRQEEERLAEEARQRAEEERRQAEEEARRKAEEEAAREAEQERLRRQAAEEKRLREEAEAKRREKQRKAEESLLRAEQARRLAEEQARQRAEEEDRRRRAAEAEAEEAARAEAEAARVEAARAAEQAWAAERARAAEEAEAAERARAAGEARRVEEAAESRETAGGTGEDPVPDNETTVPTPIFRHGDETTISTPVVRPQDARPAYPEDETAVLPQFRDATDADAEEGRESETPPPGAQDETTVLPQFRDGAPEAAGGATDGSPSDRRSPDGNAPDGNAPGRKSRGAKGSGSRSAEARKGGSGEASRRPFSGAPTDSPADRVPPGFFRDEAPSAGRGDRQRPGQGAAGNTGRADALGPNDRTRELPQLDETGAPRRRPRPDWAEETPLDDLPTLADELLGPRFDEEEDGGSGRGGGRGRGKGRRD